MRCSATQNNVDPDHETTSKQTMTHVVLVQYIAKFADKGSCKQFRLKQLFKLHNLHKTHTWISLLCTTQYRSIVIIFPVNLQTNNRAQMLHIGGEEQRCAILQTTNWHLKKHSGNKLLYNSSAWNTVLYDKELTSTKLQDLVKWPTAYVPAPAWCRISRSGRWRRLGWFSV